MKGSIMERGMRSGPRSGHARRLACSSSLRRNKGWSQPVCAASVGLHIRARGQVAPPTQEQTGTAVSRLRLPLPLAFAGSARVRFTIFRLSVKEASASASAAVKAVAVWLSDTRPHAGEATSWRCHGTAVAAGKGGALNKQSLRSSA